MWQQVGHRRGRLSSYCPCEPFRSSILAGEHKRIWGSQWQSMSTSYYYLVQIMPPQTAGYQLHSLKQLRFLRPSWWGVMEPDALQKVCPGSVSGVLLKGFFPMSSVKVRCLGSTSQGKTRCKWLGKFPLLVSISLAPLCASNLCFLKVPLCWNLEASINLGGCVVTDIHRSTFMHVMCLSYWGSWKDHAGTTQRWDIDCWGGFWRLLGFWRNFWFFLSSLLLRAVAVVNES